jgi:hypothetical protein
MGNIALSSVAPSLPFSHILFSKLLLIKGFA